MVVAALWARLASGAKLAVLVAETLVAAITVLRLLQSLLMVKGTLVVLATLQPQTHLAVAAVVRGPLALMALVALVATGALVLLHPSLVPQRPTVVVVEGPALDPLARAGQAVAVLVQLLALVLLEPRILAVVVVLAAAILAALVVPASSSFDTRSDISKGQQLWHISRRLRTASSLR